MGSTLLALLAFLLIGGAASAWIYGIRLRREEAAAGISAFAGMHWREFQRLVVAMMERRGFWSSGQQDADDGDVTLERDDGRSWLLSTRHGAGYVPTAHAIGEFANAIKLRGAAGGWMATLGTLTPEDVALARIQRIDLLDGKTLWSEIGPLLSPEQRTEIAGALRARASRQLAAAWCVAAVAGAVVLLGGPSAPRETRTEAAVVAKPATSPARPAPIAPSPARPAVRTAPAAISARSNDAESLVAHRRQVASAVGSLTWVERAVWASRSTLTVYLAGNATPVKTDLCRIIERHDQLRASRIQLQPPRGSAQPVRFMQCRVY